MRSLKRILYVEDEVDIQAVARVALETIGGYDLKICSSGQEALDSVLDFQPDLIILDVMMPVMGGEETLRKLREMDQFEQSPVIFMTAKVHENEISQFKSQGVLEVIAKPFDPMTLAKQVQSYWNDYLVLQE